MKTLFILLSTLFISGQVFSSTPASDKVRIKASFHLLACNFDQCFAKIDSKGFNFDLKKTYTKDDYSFYRGQYIKKLYVPTGHEAIVEANLSRAQEKGKPAKYFLDISIFYDGEYRHLPNFQAQFTNADDITRTVLNGAPKFIDGNVYFPQVKINDNLIPLNEMLKGQAIHNKVKEILIEN